jgi:hypothetical protein
MKHYSFALLIISLFLSANAAQHSNTEPAGQAFVKISSPSCPAGRKILGKIDSGQIICDGDSRVQVGAFKDLSNAKNFAAKMRSQGIDTSIEPGIDGQINRIFFSIGGSVSFSEDSSKLIGSRLTRDGIKYSISSGRQSTVAENRTRDAVDGSAPATKKGGASTGNAPPSVKLNLVEGLEYTYYGNSTCVNTDKVFCLNEAEYEHLCRMASGITVYAGTILTQFDSAARFLNENGRTDSTKVWWEEAGSREFRCRAEIVVSGIFNGNSRRVTSSGGVAKFVFKKPNSVLVHYTTTM